MDPGQVQMVQESFAKVLLTADIMQNAAGAQTQAPRSSGKAFASK
jgi:hypothetical protein